MREKTDRKPVHMRTTREVFEDHLRKRKEGRIEEDIAMNFAPEVVLLTGLGIYRGHEGVRENTHMLSSYLPDSVFEYTNQLVEGEVAFLEWRAKGRGAQVNDGADSFLIRDGKIIVQTIHYTVQKDQES